MSECVRFDSKVREYVAGDLDDSGLGTLLAHCRTCTGCRELLELHRDLVSLASRAPAPAEPDFEAMQRRVLSRTVRREDLRARRSATPALWQVRSASSFRVVAALAATVLLFSVGVWIGRALPGRGTREATGGVADRLLRAISADAASNHELADVEDSRFTYSNASFRRVDGGDRVAVDFDVTTHVRLVEPVQSELVQEVLVHSLLNPSSIGARLKAMSYATGAIEPKVREALIFAMRRDANLAVRLQALTILSDHLSEPGVEAAVLTALRDDDSVQMRLVALDYLASHSLDRDRIRAVIEENERPGDEALMVRLTEYEERL